MDLFKVTTIFNLYPWNDLSKYSFREKMVEATGKGVIIFFSPGFFLSKIKSLMIISVVIYFVYLLMQLLT